MRDCFPKAYCIDAAIIDENQQILLHIVTKGNNLNQVVEQTTIKIQRSRSQLWNWVKNISKHVVEKLVHKQSKVYAVHDEPLMKEECEKAKMPHGFEGAMYAIGKHVDLYAKTESPSSQKYCCYTGMPDLMPGLGRLSQSMSHLFFSLISLGDSDNETNFTEF